MMPWCPSRSSGLTWETTSGIERVHPPGRRVVDDGGATRGGGLGRELRARRRRRPRRARCRRRRRRPGVASPISRVRPSTDTVRPAERPDASRRSSPTGKSRSPRTVIIVRPTTPVAPTTATVRALRFIEGMAPQGRWSGQGTGRSIPAALPARHGAVPGVTTNGRDHERAVRWTARSSRSGGWRRTAPGA